MKNKNRPTREKQYKKPKIKKHKPFNPWITKYFDLTGTGIKSRSDSNGFGRNPEPEADQRQDRRGG